MSKAPARHAAWGAAWLVLVAAGVSLRPFTPVDETRYLAVAWEMWSRGEWLVPHLNGVFYAQKPPLLFWLIQLGWWAGGVGALWPRLVTALASLASIALTLHIARLLWPQRPRLRGALPWLLLALPYWAYFSTGLVMFDMLLVLCVLVAMCGVLHADAGAGRRGWLLAGLGIGFGVLTKGPVTLVHVLPVMLLPRVWRAPANARTGWYKGVGLAVAFGAALALAWAVPAAVSGGKAYAEAIFWRQSAGRVAASFAHRQPFWWYLYILPAFLLPWSAAPFLWRAMHALRPAVSGRDGGVRFCLVWTLVPLLVLSLVSGKQAQYLLPLLPGAVLLGARALDGLGTTVSRAELLPPSLLGALLVLGACVWAHGWAGNAPDWAHALPGWLWPAALAVLAVPPLAGAGRDARRAGALVGAGALGFFLVVYLGVMPVLAPRFDVRGVGQALAKPPCRGGALANLGSYQGQYQFAGRLRRSLDEVYPSQLKAWAAAHPGACMVVYNARGRHRYYGLEPVYAQPYRKHVAVVLHVPG